MKLAELVEEGREKEQPIEGWTVAGPEKTIGALLEDIELNERTYQRNRCWMPYECQQCLDPGMPPSKKKGVYRDLKAYMDHLKVHKIGYCQRCNIQFTGSDDLGNHRKRKHKQGEFKYKCSLCPLQY